MKKIVSLALTSALILSSTVSALEAAPGGVTSFRTGGGPVATNLPLTTSAWVLRVVETTLSGSVATSAIASDEVSDALRGLVNLYEKRATRLQDEINRLRIENSDLRAQLGSKSTSASPQVQNPTPVVTLTPVTAKSDTEKRYDAIVSNIVSTLPTILAKNKLTASGSIGLFEFIEPRNFFISLDDGKNPTGVTAFKTKILFEYDRNLNLKVVGVFDLDYSTSRYVATIGSNPFSKATRVRVRNPAYTGKLLEEIATTSGGTLTSTVGSATMVKPVNTNGTGATIAPSNATIEEVRKAYDKNKLADAVTLSTAYLTKNPADTEVLTIRARSQYIFGRFDEALTDITSIFKIQGASVDCGIVKDGARAEKALKGARWATFTDLQTKQCK